MSWTDTARSAATAVENKPVYSVRVNAYDSENSCVVTHKNEDAIGVFLPAFDFLIVFFFCYLGIQREERPRAITESG
jgi:hypothetical protein